MNKKGFTLVEVIVAMVILALLAAGLFSVMISARYLVQRSKRRLRAIEIARQEIENKRQFIRADMWDAGPLAVQDWTPWDVAMHAPFRWRYRVDPVPRLDCRKVTIQVAWDEQKI